MNKISKLISGFAMLALMLSFFAFKSEKAKFADVYYQYSGSSYGDTDYRDIANNWTNIAPPSSSPCDGSGHICVIRVDSELLSGSGPLEDQLDEYFDTLDPGDVKPFVEETSRLVYQKN